MVTIVHPYWCVRSECSAGGPGPAGRHVSRPAVLDPDDVTFLAAAVRLVQAIPIEGYPDSDVVLVELTLNLPVWDPDVPEEEFTVVFSGERARRLATLLATAGRAAEAYELW